MIFGTGFLGGSVGARAFLRISPEAVDFLAGSELFFDLALLSVEPGSTLPPDAEFSFCLAVGGDWLLDGAAEGLDEVLEEAGPGLEDAGPGFEEAGPGFEEPVGLVTPF